MLANFLIGLREGLEASLIVGILIAFAVRSGRKSVIPPIWVGVSAAIVVSAITGAVLLFGVGESSESIAPILSGSLSVLAAVLITWMVFWMAKTARNLKSELEGNLASSFGKNSFAIALVGFLAVAREGVETALFVWASVNASGESIVSTSVVFLGIGVAIALGWLFYRGALTINLRVFFQWTGAALIIVAAGIFAYGIHEFQEVGVLPRVTRFMTPQRGSAKRRLSDHFCTDCSVTAQTRRCSRSSRGSATRYPSCRCSCAASSRGVSPSPRRPSDCAERARFACQSTSVL